MRFNTARFKDAIHSVNEKYKKYKAEAPEREKKALANAQSKAERDQIKMRLKKERIETLAEVNKVKTALKKQGIESKREIVVAKSSLKKAQQEARGTKKPLLHFKLNQSGQKKKPGAGINWNNVIFGKPQKGGKKKTVTKSSSDPFGFDEKPAVKKRKDPNELW